MDKDLNTKEMDYFRQKMEYEQHKSEKYNTFRKVLYIYVLLGLVTFVFATSYFVIDRLDLNLSTPENISLIVGLIGLAMATFSYAYLAYLRKFDGDNELSNSISSNKSVFRFLESWQKFEELSRQLVNNHPEEKNINSISIRELIKVLNNHDILETEEYRQLIQALQLRNYIVHHDVNSSTEELYQHVNLLERINIRIFDIVNREV